MIHRAVSPARRCFPEKNRGTEWRDVTMGTYRIPIVWQMYGHCYIDANSLEDEIEIALGSSTPLPDGCYIDDSVAVDYEALELDQDKRNHALTKQELRLQLQQSHTLNDLLTFGPGQDCEIFKADKFNPGDVVIYVPDVALNHIPLDRHITDPEELDEVLSQCYTGQDFIDECSGDVEKAKSLFYYCDWQHPSSAINELADDHTAPSSTGGDYSPANPWDAPGMSVSDFI